MARAFSLSRSSVDGRRGISTVVATILLVIILALVGVTSYAVLGGFSKNPSTFSCQPVNSPACGKYENLHDLSLLLPFESVPQNSSVPFTASLPSGEATTGYTFNFGDGTSNTTNLTIIHHSYATPGTYIVSATATVAGVQHDDYNDLIVVTVTPSFTATTAGTTPTVQSAILGNTSVSATTASAVIQPGQFVELNASYTANPTNPQFTPISPHFKLPTGAIATNVTSSSVSQTIKVSFPTDGIYPVTFVGGASDGTAAAYENYTWTVFVGHASLVHTAVHTSPHPGTIIGYELAPGGAVSEDPAIDYETVGYEPILNVYQTLVSYNGSDTGPGWQEFVPVLATCVPGSPQCSKLYGGGWTGINGNDYTFVIQPNASFYDPVTGNSWGVYPTDVFFSLARTMGFATLPCVTCNNGWIVTQALLSHGNGTWSGIHGSYNNTPENISNSMTINETGNGDCPSAAMAPGQHGCITFHVDGNGKSWPYFLELIADGLGSSIVPCGWFSAPNQAAGIPYWTQGNVTGDGDHPCEPMGTPGWGVNISQVPPLGWDHWEQLSSGDFGTYQGHVQFNMAGSGPYYMADYAAGTGYTLKANPAYSSNPDCTWHGCQPVKGQYASTVEVFWETTATPGEQAYLGGVADFASIPSTDFSLLLQLISKGQVNAVTGPTLSIGFYPFDLMFSLQGAQRYATTQITIPQDFFSYVGIRAFFAYSYPYQTVQNTINTVHGVELGFLSGGAIPQFMANYYPKNIPWPNQNPCTAASNDACATYWWDQVRNTSSPYYDQEATLCTSASPCEFPLFGETGSPALDETNALWSSQITSLTGGAVKADPLDINFNELVGNSEFSGAGQNPMPMYSLGWAPDYPDPTDYVNPLYNPNATYTYGDSVEQQLESSQFGGGVGCPTGAASNATALFYAENYVNNTCQGNAYQSMLHLLNAAAFETNLTARVAMYTEAEQIAFHLFLYVYTGQGNAIANAASWVDPTSFNTNVTIGGGGDNTFYALTGNGVQYSGST